MNYIYIAIAVVFLILLFSFLSKLIFYVAVAALIYAAYWIMKNNKFPVIKAYLQSKFK